MFALSSMWYTLKDKNVKKCIRMGITVLKISFGEVNLQFCACKLCFTGQLSLHFKTKFATIKRTCFRYGAALKGKNMHSPEKNTIRAQVLNFFMFILAEHEILNAHKH